MLVWGENDGRETEAGQADEAETFTDEAEKSEVNSLLRGKKPLVAGFSQVVQRFILRGQPLKIFLK